MKLKFLLERESRIPTSVEYEHQIQGVDGVTQLVTIEGMLVTVQDPEDTGDSISVSTFEPQHVFVKATGEKLDMAKFLNSLDDESYQQIIAQAGENAY